MDKVYVYRKKIIRGSADTPIIDAERQFVESFIAIDEFPSLFGGYLITSNIDDPPGMSRYRGVWGKDKVRKFKRILKERGATFELCTIDGSQRFIKITSQEEPHLDSTMTRSTVYFPQVDSRPEPQIQQNTLAPETPGVLGHDIVEQMSELSPRERDVLRLQFGLDDGRARSPDEIAQLLGVTEQRIRQIAKTAFDKLRDPADIGNPQEGTSAF